MEKEIFEVTIKVIRDKQFKPHYMSGERTFKVSATRGRLFQSLDSAERKLTKKYPIEKELPVTNETK